jgi:hypothetical protein
VCYNYLIFRLWYLLLTAYLFLILWDLLLTIWTATVLQPSSLNYVHISTALVSQHVSFTLPELYTKFSLIHYHWRKGNWKLVGYGLQMACFSFFVGVVFLAEIDTAYNTLPSYRHNWYSLQHPVFLFHNFSSISTLVKFLSKGISTLWHAVKAFFLPYFRSNRILPTGSIQRFEIKSSQGTPQRPQQTLVQVQTTYLVYTITVVFLLLVVHDRIYKVNFRSWSQQIA